MDERNDRPEMSAGVPRRRLWSGATWPMGCFALVAGALSVWGTHRYVSDRISEVEAGHRVATVTRLVADVDLEPGDTLSAAVVAVAQVPEQWALAQGLTPEDFEEHDTLMLAHPVAAGNQLLPAHFAPRAPQALASRLGPGRRAVTIPVDDISSQAGWLQPGNRLDIYLTLDRDGRRTHLLLLKSSLILAVGQRADHQEEGGPANYSTVTLDVSQQEALRLIAARETGLLSAILQNDPEQASTLVSIPREIEVALGLVAPPPVARRKTVPIMYGSMPASDAVPAQGALDSEPSRPTAWDADDMVQAQ